MLRPCLGSGGVDLVHAIQERSAPLWVEDDEFVGDDSGAEGVQEDLEVTGQTRPRRGGQSVLSSTAHAFQLWWWGEGMHAVAFTLVHAWPAAIAEAASGVS
jgi:hypothetical protein